MVTAKLLYKLLELLEESKVKIIIMQLFDERSDLA